jgi:hypothetical protein
MPANQLGERLVRSLVGVEAKQFGVIAHGFALSSTGSLQKPHKKSSGNGELSGIPQNHILPGLSVLEL